MTTVAVPDTSCRGCPRMAAGTTLQQLAARISPYALPSTIRCRTDRSGFVADPAHAAHPYDPSATIPSYSRPVTESATRTLKPSHHAANLSPEPYSGLPIGDKRAFPPPTVPAPNRPQYDNLLQTAGALGAAPIPMSVAGFASSDRTHTPLICVTCQRTTTPTRDASTSSRRSRRAANSPVAGRHAPPRQSRFVDSDRTPLFQRSVHRMRPAVGRFTPVSATKSRLSPRRRQTQTAVHPRDMVNALHFVEAWKV